jgi:hypothetical protein
LQSVDSLPVDSLRHRLYILAINGARLTAGARETEGFLLDLYETGTFNSRA